MSGHEDQSVMTSLRLFCTNIQQSYWEKTIIEEAEKLITLLRVVLVDLDAIANL